jgi:hypothetical protein
MIRDLSKDLLYVSYNVYLDIQYEMAQSVKSRFIYKVKDTPPGSGLSPYNINLILKHFEEQGAIKIFSTVEFTIHNVQVINYEWDIGINRPQFYDLEKIIKRNITRLSQQKTITDLTEAEDYKSYFGFDGLKFSINLISGGTPASIDFHPKEKEGTAPYYLMKAFVNELYKFGVTKNARAEVNAKRQNLVQYIKNEWPNYYDAERKDWVTDTLSNLKRKIPKEYNNQELITFGSFNRKGGYYPVSIKLPF